MSRRFDPDAYQAIQNLSRIAQASARWMSDLAYKGRLSDLNDELPHIQANLDQIQRMLHEASTLT
jgi:hypothetical protein